MTVVRETGPSAAGTGGRVPSLDGLRGVAVLLILLYHFFTFGVLVVEPADLPLDTALLHIVEFGWTAVDLFFVLSGFLITGILLDAKGTPHFFRFFYARRMLRVFPAYYLFLIIAIVIIPAIPALRDDRTVAIVGDHQWWYWGYLANVWVATNHSDPLSVALYGNSHLWSLAVEQQFYLLWPAVVFLTTRRGLFAVCIGCVVLCPAVRAVLAGGVVPGLDTDVAPYVLTPARLDSLAMGAMVAVAIRSSALQAWLRRCARAVIVVGATTLVVLAIARDGLSTSDIWVQLVGFSAAPLMYAGLLAVLVTAPPDRAVVRAGATPLLTFLGRYSYALYVVHIEVIILLSNQFGRDAFGSWFGSETPGRLLFTAMGIAVSLVVAVVSWHACEKRFLRLKRYFERAPGDLVPIAASSSVRNE